MTTRAPITTTVPAASREAAERWARAERCLAPLAAEGRAWLDEARAAWLAATGAGDDRATELAARRLDAAQLAYSDWATAALRAGARAAEYRRAEGSG